jgi:hypothetical protein
MKRWLARTALVLGLLVSLATPAAADPPSPVAVPVTCDSTTYLVGFTPGRADFTPALATTGNQVLVPVTIDLTFSDLTTGESEDLTAVKGAGQNPNAVSCTVNFTTTDPETGHLVNVQGSFTAVITPVG